MVKSPGLSDIQRDLGSNLEPTIFRLCDLEYNLFDLSCFPLGYGDTAACCIALMRGRRKMKKESAYYFADGSGGKLTKRQLLLQSNNHQTRFLPKYQMPPGFAMPC